MPKDYHGPLTAVGAPDNRPVQGSGRRRSTVQCIGPIGPMHCRRRARRAGADDLVSEGATFNVRFIDAGFRPGAAVSRPPRVAVAPDATSRSGRPLLWSIVTVRFEWHACWPPPTELEVRQVYGWICDTQGRVLLLRMPGGWNLPGGTPETVDHDWMATLHREVLEEADLTLRQVVPLGYQIVRSQGPAFVQLRVAARVDQWFASTPDPDNGLVYPRVWTPLGEAAELLGWGAPGRAQAAAAARVAYQVYGFAAAEAVAQGASEATAPVTQLV